jgi:sulfur carrier protein ThiS adenylyltransferase
MRPGDRFLRQADLIPRARLEPITVTVVGVGAIGRSAALQLAALGVRQLTLVDFDTVDLTNITTQGYRAAEVGRLKVDAAAAAVAEIDPSVVIRPIADRFRPPLSIGEAVFCCVDSITARSAIWKSAESRGAFWADGRMRGEVIRVLAAADEASRAYYARTLFPQGEAQAGPCTSRSVGYAASVAAGLMVHQFARFLRGLAIDRDASLNLLAGELNCS